MKFEYYQDDKGEWRWRLKSRNGKIIADSAEGYAELRDCLDGIELVREASESAVVVSVDA